ncbi:GAF domain-containing protein [Rheinheimera riviphila]|uniref:GAF domain-containing protein n=1 Tax=Rheinheimera riviphila TaxID=1834037 RepID=A0A437QSC6_9GAMM|nr:GAF domain-containing protein [Rheinheimera riviphila]RVU37392.1 GAF domain-containing protein [Rheinheimera riviphila]
MTTLATLAQINRQIDPINDILGLCQTVSQLIVQSLQLPDNVIYLKNNHNRLSQIAAAGGKFCANQGVVSPIELELGQGVVGMAALCQSSLCVADTNSFTHYVVDDAPRLSELAVPVCYQGELLGIIDAEHPQAGFFTIEQQYFVESVSAILAPRLVNLRSRQQSTSISPARTGSSTATYDTANTYCSQDEFSQLLQSCLKHFYQPAQWDQSRLSQLALLQPVTEVRAATAIQIESLKQHIYCCLQQMYQKPATALWAKILDERYISSRIGQIQLADQYHMSFSTFRRQQQQAQNCLQQSLWQLELQARDLRRG